MEQKYYIFLDWKKIPDELKKFPNHFLLINLSDLYNNNLEEYSKYIDNVNRYSDEVVRRVGFDLDSTDISDVSKLGRFHKLCLNNTKVKDASPLKKVRNIQLINCPIEDASMLGNAHTLFLCGTNVTDVSNLGNIFRLEINKTKVSDVSALSNVYELGIRQTKVKDISNLGNVHSLYLYNTPLNDIDTYLGNVEELWLPEGKCILRPTSKSRELIHNKNKEYHKLIDLIIKFNLNIKPDELISIVLLLQSQYRIARYNPEYTFCQQVFKKGLEECFKSIGIVLES